MWPIAKVARSLVLSGTAEVLYSGEKPDKYMYVSTEQHNHHHRVSFSDPTLLRGKGSGEI